MKSLEDQMKNVTPTKNEINNFQKTPDDDLVGNEFLPYDFVSIDPINSTYKNKTQKDLKNNYTGVITVELTLKSPMVAINELTDDNSKNNIDYYKKIPASSIRGMLHNAAEIIWNDVLTVAENRYGKREDFTILERRYIPTEWLSLNSRLDSHGLAAHLFGFVENDRGNKKEKRKNNALSSSLRFTDAITEEADIQEAYLKPYTLAQPQGLIDMKKERLLRNSRRPVIEKDYFNPAYMVKTPSGLKPAGRKVYLAGRTIDLKEKCISSSVKEPFKKYVGVNQKIDHILKNPNTKKIILVAPGTTYTFNIQFKNLNREDLAALVRLVELNDGAETSELAKGATYAIGRGRPLGFGRVRLTVNEIKVRDYNSIFNLSEAEFSKSIDKSSLYEGENPYQKKYDEYFALTNLQLFDKKKRYKIGKESRVVQYTKMKRR